MGQIREMIELPLRHPTLSLGWKPTSAVQNFFTPHVPGQLLYPAAKSASY